MCCSQQGVPFPPHQSLGFSITQLLITVRTRKTCNLTHGSVTGREPCRWLSTGLSMCLHKGRSSSLCPENSTAPPNLLCSGSCLNLPWEPEGHFRTLYHSPSHSLSHIHLFHFSYTITMASILVNLHSAPRGCEPMDTPG